VAQWWRRRWRQHDSVTVAAAGGVCGSDRWRQQWQLCVGWMAVVAAAWQQQLGGGVVAVAAWRWRAKLPLAVAAAQQSDGGDGSATV
jgi:hypothetical protein